MITADCVQLIVGEVIKYSASAVVTCQRLICSSDQRLYYDFIVRLVRCAKHWTVCRWLFARFSKRKPADVPVLVYDPIKKFIEICLNRLLRKSTSPIDDNAFTESVNYYTVRVVQGHCHGQYPKQGRSTFTLAADAQLPWRQASREER